MEAGVAAYRQQAARDERERLILEHLEDVRHILGRIAARLPADVDRQNLESAGVLEGRSRRMAYICSSSPGT